MIVSRVDAAIGNAVRIVFNDGAGVVACRMWIILLLEGRGCDGDNEFDKADVLDGGGKKDSSDAGIRRIADDEIGVAVGDCLSSGRGDSWE